MPGETLNNQSNFNKQEVSLYAHLYEKYVEIKNVDGTVEITPDKYNWHNGGVVLEYVDCRPRPTCTGKRILLRQNTASLWDDVLRINQDAGGTLTQEMAIQVESQLLLAMHPTIDLDPNSTLQDMKRYDPADGPVEPVHRELRTRKRKLNSYELEQEAAKKAKKEQMMFMMDERHGREFKPTFKLLPYFKRNRNKVSTVGKGKQRADTEAEQGRGSSKKSGRKLVRLLRFERSFTDENDKTYKLFTLLNIYQDVNGQHEAICHSISEKDLRSEGKYNSFMQTINAMSESKEYKVDDSRATFRNELGNAEAYKAFIKSFVVLYSIDNNLKFDSERVDKVPVEMLTEVTTELTSPQTEMKFDNMSPYEIIEYLCQQSDTGMTTNSNEGAKDLSVADLYNAAAKKALQAKPSVSAPVNQDQSLMSPPQRRRNSQRSRQTTTTQAQASTPNPQFLMQTGNQTPTQQQISQAQIQPQVMTTSQSPSQRPIQSPALIQPNFSSQVPQSSAEGTRPIQQIPIAGVPIQLSNGQMSLQQVPLMQGQPNVRQQGRPIGPVRIVQSISNLTHATQVNARPVTNQSVAQGTTIQNTITSPSMQKVLPVRRTTQGQSQQVNVPAQQTAQMNISPQANSTQMNQVPQINIPTQQTDPRVSQLNIQNQINQVQSAAQISIPTQVDQINIQTTPRINPGRVTQINSHQTRSTPQINIPAQVSDQMQTTPRINPAQVPQVNAADQMNVHILQMNRVNPRMMQPTDQNISPQRNNIVNRPPLNIQQQQYLQHLAAMRIPAQQIRANGFIRHPAVMNMQGSMQQPFMQVGIPIQGQLLPGQQQNGIRPQARSQFNIRPIYIRQNVANMGNVPMIPQQVAAQQLMNGGGQWIFQQNQNQPLQQPPNPQNSWNNNGNC
ncbi:uncharacterized protein OCT59_025120 [Rhizophagus irregularis]|uniref:uncharacterized protein n=1 Tax=Rhizophagus irregularis TaxID=588596 RepID=UPI0019DBB830|nr:hypothetical protein OCT59_025120 [Rhizophagus irregularis]GET51745.1 Spt20 family-domain-containing protein [Rhizophagus irregularis DAOM 181602=DAOM 197198]